MFRRMNTAYAVEPEMAATFYIRIGYHGFSTVASPIHSFVTIGYRKSNASVICTRRSLARCFAGRANTSNTALPVVPF